MQKIYNSKYEVNENLTLLTESKIFIDRINNSSIVYNCNGLMALANEIAKIFNKELKYRVCSNKNEFYKNECLEVLYEEKVIGYIGAIKNTILENYGMSKRKIYAMSIN
jgi:phenylalanyl-tRNA synthetase beta subunit